MCQEPEGPAGLRLCCFSLCLLSLFFVFLVFPYYVDSSLTKPGGAIMGLETAYPPDTKARFLRLPEACLPP